MTHLGKTCSELHIHALNQSSPNFLLLQNPRILGRLRRAVGLLTRKKSDGLRGLPEGVSRPRLGHAWSSFFVLVSLRKAKNLHLFVRPSDTLFGKFQKMIFAVWIKHVWGPTLAQRAASVWHLEGKEKYCWWLPTQWERKREPAGLLRAWKCIKWGFAPYLETPVRWEARMLT